MIANPNDGNSPRVEVATPIIDVSAEGLITATTEQEAGYVPGGTKSATQQLPTQGAKTVTPGTTNQTAVASGRYTTGAVTVKGDANLKAENIAEGVSIFGVQGTFAGGGETVEGSFQSFSTRYGVNVLVYTGPDGPTWSEGIINMYNIKILKDSAVYINTSDTVSAFGGITEISRPLGINSAHYLYKVTSDFTIYFD